MSYRIETDKPLMEELQRAAREQIDKALDSIENEEDRSEAVHDVRKRCKKIRAILRLVRPALPSGVYDRENAFFRDIARRLAPVRDATVRIETLEELLERHGDTLDADAFAEGLEKLRDRHASVVEEHLHNQERLKMVGEALRAVRNRVNTWRITKDEWPAIELGLGKVYKRGCKAYPKAYEKGTPEAFHEWRKRAKYLWYHTRLLRDTWKKPNKKMASELDDLGDMLGEDHDLSELAKLMPELIQDKEAREALLELLRARSRTYRQNALTLAARIYAEEPEAYLKRMRAYWNAARSEAAGHAPRSGMVADEAYAQSK